MAEIQRSPRDKHHRIVLVTPQKIKEQWIPAFVLEKTERGFQIKELTIKIPESWNLGNTGFDSTSKISPSVRNEQKKLIRTYMSFLNSLNLSNPKVISMLENNVFILVPIEGVGGGYLSRINENFRLLTSSGSNYEQRRICPVYDLVHLSPEKGTGNLEGMRNAFIHELLHDQFETLAPKIQSEIGTLFLSLFARASEPTRIQEYFQYGNYISLNGFEKEIDSFISFRFPSIAPDRTGEIKKTLQWYCYLRSHLEGKIPFYKDKPDHKTYFMKMEAFSYLFEFRCIPDFLRPIYSDFLSSDSLNGANTFKSTHLSTAKSFRSFLPVISDFTDYISSSIN